MSSSFAMPERRLFGRRAANYAAVLHSHGRPPLAGQVRNITVRGALLELEAPYALPYEVRIVVDALGIDVRSAVRHQGRHGVGVEFLDPLPAAALRRLPPIAAAGQLERAATVPVRTRDLREQLFHDQAEPAEPTRAFEASAPRILRGT